ncbi:hypothetical protein FQN60_016061 [Etheostoma spectabile]|uniref:ZP domain-containing protein n=1 Tax=Etheostoma spectabile TaxID=54343 RepID=A0A5J5CBS5_9PERO|nr:hypothetical protein FQN60_016061 [Etheostoma spectabile]
MMKPGALLLLLAGVVHAVPPPVGIVTGSTIIDIFNVIRSIPDRCVYKLMGSADFEILAGFQERSRADVPFLDSVTINVGGVPTYLGQGGVVKVGDQTLTLNATAQLINDVAFSKDQTGVTVHCEVLYSDPPNNATNCNIITEHCDLLMKAPFTDCHDHVDPAPYVTACVETSCRFPTVEGLALTCQFVDAYAKVCALKTNNTLVDWRSPTQCSKTVTHYLPQDSCLDLYCSENEFCGETNGETQCICRALFAAKYNPTNSLGDPTVCTDHSATLTLAGCLLSAKHIDYTTLHLLNESCKGHMDAETHMVTFSFDRINSCGTEVTKTNSSQIIYTNTITMQNSSADVITRQDQVAIDFSCFSVVQEIESGTWNYTLMMKAYTDASFVHPVGPDTEFVLDQRVWVELETDGLDDNLVSIVTDSCWATNQPTPDASLQHHLIING